MATKAYHESRTSDVYGATISLVVAATFAVALRLIARQISASKFWWDDWTLVLALIFDYGLSVCYWLQVTHSGLGRHSTAYGGPVTEGQINMYNKIFLSLQIFYFASAVAIKTSLILLYYRVFGVIRWFRWELAFAWIIVVLYFLVGMLVAVFECKPVSYFWEKSIPGGTCINQTQFYRWIGVANLLIDFMILTLTMPLIWHMNLKTRQKLYLTLVFLLGFFACVASIVRVVTINDVNLADVTYTNVNSSMWSTIEQSIGIICACLITCQPLLSRVSSFINARRSAADGRRDPLKMHELPSINTRSPKKSPSDATAAGFARLEEAVGTESSVTIHVTTAGTGKFSDMPECDDREAYHRATL